MRKVGIVASLSTVTDAQLILNDGEERNAKAEHLVLIHNRNGNDVLAVCRTAVGSNENLSIGGFSPGIAYARLGKHPSNAKEYYAFMLDVLGDVSKGKLQQNKTVLAPGSDVELFEDADNPMSYLGISQGSALKRALIDLPEHIIVAKKRGNNSQIDQIEGSCHLFSEIWSPSGEAVD